MRIQYNYLSFCEKFETIYELSVLNRVIVSYVRHGKKDQELERYFDQIVMNNFDSIKNIKTQTQNESLQKSLIYRGIPMLSSFSKDLN